MKNPSPFVPAALSMALGALMIFLSACDTGTGPASLSQTATTLQYQRIDSHAATLAECANGGIEMVSYIDANNNLVRDAGDTLVSTNVVCSGANGANGTNGVDGHNGTNGTNGLNGTNGSDGSAGQNGRDGIDGQNGINAEAPYTVVYSVTPKAPGCKFGGNTVSFGLDVNRNEMLDEEDKNIQSFEVCNGQDGSDSAQGEESGETENLGDPACIATLKFTSTWKDGYVVEVDVQNLGKDLSSWEVGFVLTHGQEISKIWNANVKKESGKVVAKNMDYNSVIMSGKSANFGLQVSRSDAERLLSKPITLNGKQCK